MAYALRGNVYRHHQTAGNRPGGWWWLPGLGVLAAVIILAMGRSAPDLSSVADVPSPGIAIVPAAAPVANEGHALPATSAVPAPVIATVPEVLAPPIDTSTVAPQPPAADTRSGAGIREIDFTALPLTQALARQLSGRVDAAQVRYVDVTGDGREEALVAITSDGTFGNLAVVVFTEQGGVAREMLTRVAGQDRRGVALTVEAGQLIETVGVYGASDANCCPGQVARTYFRWDETKLVVARTETITNAAGKQAE